tara:strand:+ start:142 stop:447 length:306 start_codon:yes stop_codon:yes gene_type:complete
MKNTDIDEWLLNNNIDPNTEIIADEKQWFLSDILEKHLKEQFAIHGVVVELPSKKSKEFERWAQSKGYEPAFNGLWYEKNNQTYNTDLLHRAFTNEIEFGN